ncbi:hypothetical protein B0I26_10598, partial [Anoxybacillus vitaminiphilus]
MEIRNYITRQAAFAHEQPIVLKNGETYEATIKEKMNANEAIVNIKGTDIRVQVEGELPQEERVMIEVKAQQGDVPVVKVIPQSQTAAKPQTNDVTTILTKLGAGENVPVELKQAGQLLLSKEMPLTKETVAVLKTFFAEAPGTVEQKLDTIRALVNKGLEVTNAQITAVHEALHGKPLGEVLTSIAKQLDASFTFTKQEVDNNGRVTKEVLVNVRKEIQREPNFAKVIERVTELAKTAETDVSEALNKAVREAVAFHEKGQQSFARSKIVQTLVALEQSASQEARVQRGMSEYDLAEQVKKLREHVQREPLVGRAIAIVKEKMVDNRNVSHHIQEKLASSLKEVERLRQIGQPLSAKEKLLQALTQVEDEIAANSKITEAQVHDGAEQAVQVLRKAKDIIRNTNHFPEAIQRLKNEIISRVDEKTAAEMETLIERASIAQKIGKDRLIQAFTQIEKELASQQAVRTDQVGQALRMNEAKTQSSANLAELVKVVRSQVMKEADLTKALAHVRTQLIHNDSVPEEMQQKVAQVIQEAQMLKTNGQEAMARRQIVQALADLEQSIVQEKPIVRNVADQIKQVHEQVAREPNLAKAAEQVRQQIVDAPEMNREVAEKVNRALHEVAQLQRMGREGEGRARLVQALTQLEQELRMQEPANQVKQVREQAAREPNLAKAVEQVRQQIVDAPEMDREVAQKVDRALREVVQLQQMGREGEGRARLVQALEQVEQELRTQEPVNQVKQVREQVMREPNLAKAVEQVRQHIVDAPEMDREVAEKVNRALREVVQLQRMGREGEGRVRLVQALTQAEEALRANEGKYQNLTDLVKEVRSQMMKEADLTKALVHVRTQLIHNDSVPEEMQQKVAQVLKEAQVLKANGQEAMARRQVIQALTELEQSIVQEKPIVREVANQIKQVREQVTREPNLTKAVEQVRQHIMDAPEMNREVAEKVDRALREVVQLQQMGREGEARARLVQALTQAEQELRTQEPANQVKQVREQAAREPNLAKAVEQVRQNIVDAPEMNREVAQKVDRALREVVQLQQMGREGEGRARLVQALTQVEQELRTQEPANEVKQVREQVMREPNLAKAVEQVRQQIVDAPEMDREVAEKVDRALREVVQLQQMGREGEGRAHLTQVLTQVEQELRMQEPVNQLKQVREQAAREPNLSKVVEQVRQQIVDAPEMDREVAEKVDRALREVVQLQQMGREGEG